MTTTAATVCRTDRLDHETLAEVFSLLSTAGDADGAYPLSEHVVLHLRHGGETPAVHLLVRREGELAGYAHVDPTDAVEGASAELVVHPMHRRRGLGRALAREAIMVANELATNHEHADHEHADRKATDHKATDHKATDHKATDHEAIDREAADASSSVLAPAGSGEDRDVRVSRRLRLWAHGDHPSASALALSLGFERWRVLWQMRRSLYAPVPVPTFAPGVRLRAFRPGEDDQAWLALNAEAFADHPDQGRWTLADLRTRLSERWFDPNGFLLAERDGELIGFHWTKIHGDLRAPHGGPNGAGAHPHHHAHDPIGEVYVLGVGRAARGTGLGTALTLAGLRHLRGRGLDQAMLYVDEANERATALYQRLGFARWSTDVCFRREI